jgi:GH15 family glucan-1,4-alpha-glucosidase
MTRHPANDSDHPYPPLSEYGFISDCHSMALVCTTGSIDWCCMPRVDSASCFGRLLDWKKGGYCQIRPDGEYRSSRRYLDDTLVLETTFESDSGKAKLYDCFALRAGGRKQPYQQLIRIVEGMEGEMDMRLYFYPGFDYGTLQPWVRNPEQRTLVALGGPYGLIAHGDFDLHKVERHGCSGGCTIGEGERRHFAITFDNPENLDGNDIDTCPLEELDRRLDYTINWWRDWTSKGTFKGPYADPTKRSAIVLKGLSNAPTGAIAAAPTTSLPESDGGSRNWDYRFTWIRDSVFTARSLWELGFESEADGFRRFVERSAAGSAEQIQIMYGVGGERRLDEYELSDLEGYRGSAPVRVGNAAQSQLQLDVFGELLDLAYHWHHRGNSPDDDYWQFIVRTVNRTIEVWRRPDRGLWEMRGEPKHFVQSKAMCWAALDCGIRMAEELDREAPLEIWKNERSEIRRHVEEKGYDKERGVFIQAFGQREMDAALLLLPMFRFVAFDDERMIRTVNAIQDELEEDGLIRRYSAESDGMPGEEGTFLACTFWIAECLALQGRTDDARKSFERACKTANDLGLFAEEFDPAAGRMLGNFPQALTHLSLIQAAVAIADGSRDRRKKRS